ncbi:MAG TPA: hypothetical protein VHA82_04255 [Ramlibacter sp.]|uniref:hypothetical protein n=1 Tax=Ramlibacter sp. TaxID=1917967 RepID=UPI002C3DE33B|nr:hypothetical protein [Ramlibacter sp.]HVZ43002.1 hypothetical protein [Ramlibacter sp.]
MRKVSVALAVAFVVAVTVAAAAFARTPDDEWLDTREAREFRDRVVTLALIYGESSGIDPRGFKVTAKETDAPDAQGCADVEIVTFRAEVEVRREALHACGHR